MASRELTAEVGSYGPGTVREPEAKEHPPLKTVAEQREREHHSVRDSDL
jgi:hypothetical protein